jgi:DNA-binding Lrp family transcriptional regulator
VEHVSLLDTLDRSILQEMTKGVSSYDTLAQKLNVNRSTIYRRIRALERNKIIAHQTRVLVDFAKLNLVAVLVAANVSNENVDGVLSFFSMCPYVKMVWQSFGAHNLFALILCDKGDEGNKILEIRRKLEEFKVAPFDFTVGFRWQKAEMTPF